MAFLPLFAAAQDRAEELFDAGQWRAAQHLLEQQPPSPKRDFRLATCAINMGDVDGGMRLIDKFIIQYSNSIYIPDIQLLAAFCYFDRGDWTEALEWFHHVGKPPHSRHNEYYFKRGFAEFATGKDAQVSFIKVEDGEYEPYARYYLAYIKYANNSLAEAKLAFRTLADHPAFASIIPYYLLQIEFLEGNFEYVISGGEEMLAQAEGVRRGEIARVVAESYFHRGDYHNTLKYMDLYSAEGGAMGRHEYYILGYLDYSTGHPARAAAALARVAGPDDRLSQNAAYHMAAAALEMGDKREAMQSFSIAAAGNYDPALQEEALFNYGKLQFELGGGVFNEAINVLQRYVETYPDSPRAAQASEYLAAAYYNTRNYEAAYDALKRISHLDKNLRTAFQKITYSRALELYDQGDTARAYKMLEESSRSDLDPKYAALTRFWIGEILARGGRWQEATEHLRQYIAVAPTSAYEYKMALYDLGYAYFNLRDQNAARAQFEKFLTSYPVRDSYRADALNRIGDIYFVNREFWRAIEAYDSAAAIGTDERYYAIFQRAMTLGHVDRSARKIESLNAIIDTKQGPYVDDAIYELGLEYIANQRFAEAATTMRKYVEGYPNGHRYAAALTDLGLIYQNMGNVDAATNYYKQVVSRVPASPYAKDAMLALRTIYVSLNRVDEYFAYAEKSGVETDLGAIQRDSLAYTASAGSGLVALETYLRQYPTGAWRADALFLAAGAATTSDTAIRYYSELLDMPHNSFTVRALERLSPLLEDAGRYSDAAAAWQKLAATATDPNTVAHARVTYEDMRRKASFAEAQELEKSGNHTAATAIYRDLATESHSDIGARATLKVIESLYAAGDLEGAQDLIMRFSREGSAHQADLARAFLILGDIYIRRGDVFQARATWQSIVDGYSRSDDGIVDEARKKIEQL